MDIIKFNDHIENINSTKSSRLLKQREKIKGQEWFFSFEGKIPKHWFEVNFMDVTWLITCGVAKKPIYVEEGIPFLSAQNTRPFKTNLNKIKYVSKEAFEKLSVGGKPEKNDILYTRVGNCGEAASIPYDFDFAVYVSLTLIKPIHELVDHSFLVAFLNSHYGRIQANVGAIGIGLKNLNVDNVRKFKIPLPPLPEQRAIVAKIEELFSSLDSGIADLQKAQAQLKIYRQAVLKKAFEGELTKEWRSKQTNLLTAEDLLKQIKKERQNHYNQQVENWEKAVKLWAANDKEGKKPNKPIVIKELKSSKDSLEMGLINIPDSWCSLYSENLSDFITKGTTPQSSELLQNKGEVPFIKVYNLTFNGLLDFKINPTFVSNEIHNNFLQRSIIYPNDVLMNIVGPPLGKVSIVPDTFPEWNMNQAIVRFRPYRSLSYKYLALYLMMEGTIRQVSRKAKATAGQFNLTLEICRQIIVPLGSIEEQCQIVQEIESRLSVCDKVEESIVESLEKAKALRQSILKKAFEGRLLSEQELAACKSAPDYDPASVLLKRIKTEKSKVKKMK